MKFCIVSDIHGNLRALEYIINYADKENIKTILNLGDIFGGENDKEVFLKIINDKRFISVRGNHDDNISGYITDNSLKECILRYKNIPLKRVVTLGDRKFLMVHSRETSNRDIPIIYNGGSIEEFIDDYSEEVDYVLMGQTHLQMLLTYYGKKTIINPGSLGLSYDNSISFCVGYVTDDEVNFDFKKINLNS